MTRGSSSRPADQVSPRRQNVNALAITLIGVLAAGWMTYLFAPSVKQHEDDATDPMKLGEAAFHITVRESFREDADGTTWVFPAELPVETFSFLNARPTAGSSQGIAEHEKAKSERLAELGGVRVSSLCYPDCVSVSRYRVTLTGNRKQPVHIESMRARIRSERAAPAGTLLVIPRQGGGPVDVVHIDLDSPNKDALTADREGKPTGRVFTDVENRFAGEGEPLVFEVVGATRRPVLYEWELVLEVTQDGRRETVVVNLESGDPFRTVGWRAVPKYGVTYGRDTSGSSTIVELAR
ncbi:hypothetical protein [Micromonospora sp. KC213]|uniref:hypothetical protein n=1 Tax=Micromonospora sp. KC213 TaxID=2530378 RepID=UPI00104AAF30|nr:hypothetical protein [Micromonospora sp. KC213]TDC41403.1 hypothetical protein E1166_11810 [Micromonospora sp. KC213]